ncbi:hypothetical protein BU15DRAFT_82342 [Melanogaster broomeanus]|nr:hypothetical protein BU15DRAFT_82342 [Melanogaster broomeanus]
MELLLSLLSSHAHGWVISLGGGIIETPAAREALINFGKEQGRKVARVKSELEQCKSWFAQCAGYEFRNYDSINANSGGLDAEIEQFFGHVLGLKPNLAPNVLKVGEGVRLYFLSLTYPDITPARPSIPELSTGIDALKDTGIDTLKLCINLLHKLGAMTAIASHAYVSHQISTLRCKTSLPLVFTVHTVSQGSAFPDKATKEAADLLKLTLLLGCKYIDMEMILPPNLIKKIVSLKGASHIITSSMTGQAPSHGICPLCHPCTPLQCTGNVLHTCHAPSAPQQGCSRPAVLH